MVVRGRAGWRAQPNSEVGQEIIFIEIVEVVGLCVIGGREDTTSAG